MAEALRTTACVSRLQLAGVRLAVGLMICGVQLSPFNPIWIDDWPNSGSQTENSVMKKPTLEGCVESLIEIRRRKHGELDPSVAKELDDVIEHLKFLLETGGEEVRLKQKWATRLIGLFDQVTGLLVKIEHLIDQLKG